MCSPEVGLTADGTGIIFDLREKKVPDRTCAGKLVGTVELDVRAWLFAVEEEAAASVAIEKLIIEDGTTRALVPGKEAVSSR